MSDSRFHELRSIYTKWENLRIQRFHSCVRLTKVISEGFREYVGAPMYYETISSDPENRGKELYATLATVSPLDEDNLYHFKSTNNPNEALSEDKEEGTLVFGVGLTVDRGTQTFPKRVVWYRVGIRFEDSQIKLRIYNKNFFGFPEGEAASLDRDKLQPLYEQMCEFAKEAFSGDPWERPGSGASIGFINSQ